MNNNDYDDIVIFTVLLAANAVFWVWCAALFASKFLSNLVLV